MLGIGRPEIVGKRAKSKEESVIIVNYK